jgi:hypothetical protein
LFLSILNTAFLFVSLVAGSDPAGQLHLAVDTEISRHQAVPGS